MSTAKVMKTIALTAAAQEQHISMKMKSILKWLKSGHDIRVQIQGKADRQKAMENIFKQIEREVKQGANIQQKVTKPEVIKFYLKPTAAAANFVVDESGAEDATNLDEMTSGKDLLSDDFEKELTQSIASTKSHNKKKP